MLTFESRRNAGVSFHRSRSSAKAVSGAGFGGVKMHSMAVRSSDGFLGIGYSCRLAYAKAFPDPRRIDPTIHPAASLFATIGFMAASHLGR